MQKLRPRRKPRTGKRVRFKPQGIAAQTISVSESAPVPKLGEYLINILPVPKPRMTQFDVWKPAAQRYFKYADKLRSLAPSVQWEGLQVRFIMPMPKSWSQKKKDLMVGKPHTQTPDLDNLIKAFKDALMEQDSAVWYYKRVMKVWGVTAGIAVMPDKQGDTAPEVS